VTVHIPAKTLILAAALCLAACSNQLEPLSPAFGDAVSRNMAAQIINPEGSRVAELPAQDGARVIRAHDRLLKEEKDPKEIQLPVFVLGNTGTAK
jgi:hypothetical protein